MSLVMLCSSDVYTLINYTSFVESGFIGISVAGLLYLRYKCPDLPRPIKVTVLHLRFKCPDLPRPIKVRLRWCHPISCSLHKEKKAIGLWYTARLLKGPLQR